MTPTLIPSPSFPHPLSLPPPLHTCYHNPNLIPSSRIPKSHPFILSSLIPTLIPASSDWPSLPHPYTHPFIPHLCILPDQPMRCIFTSTSLNFPSVSISKFPFKSLITYSWGMVLVTECFFKPFSREKSDNVFSYTVEQHTYSQQQVWY